MADFDDIVIHPNSTAAHIAGMCDALSDEHGSVSVRIYSVNGEMRFRFERERADTSLPVFLRRQSEG